LYFIQPIDALLTDVLDVAKEAARAAGAIILENAKGADVLSNKANAKDLLTLIDPLCEKTIKDCVLKKFPLHEFLGEEDVPPGPQAAAKAVEEKLNAANDKDNWLWVVDPIDGTTNFVHGMPLCMPSIAATYKGKVMVAAIYDCHRNEMYTAVRGQGTFCNDEKLHVAETKEIGQAVVAMGSPPGEESIEKSLLAIPALMPKVRTLRFLGSAALMLAWVGHSRLSAYWEWDLSAWDTAAGALLIKEAGGEITDLEGQPYTLTTRRICASNGGALHHELLRILREDAKLFD
jgi:myo-inositol-1(or 4)-monophosphatase